MARRIVGCGLSDGAFEGRHAGSDTSAVAKAHAWISGHPLGPGAERRAVGGDTLYMTTGLSPSRVDSEAWRAEQASGRTESHPPFDKRLRVRDAA